MKKSKLILLLISLFVISSFQSKRLLRIYIFKSLHNDIVYIKLPDAGGILVNAASSKNMDKLLPRIQDINLSQSPLISRIAAKLFGWGFEVDRIFLSRIQNSYISGLYIAVRNLMFKVLYASLAQPSNIKRWDSFISAARNDGITYKPYFGIKKIDVRYGTLNSDVEMQVFGSDTYLSIPRNVSPKVKHNIIYEAASIFSIDFGNFSMVFDLKAGNLLKQEFVKDYNNKHLSVLYTLGGNLTFINYLSPQHLIWANRINTQDENRLASIYGKAFFKAYKYDYRFIYIETDGQELVLKAE